MEDSLRKIFNERGIFNAAPSFENDFMFYDRKRLWSRINCLGYALSYKGEDFPEHSDRITKTLFSGSALSVGWADIFAHTSVVPIEDNNLINIPQGHYPIAGFMPSALTGCIEDDYWLMTDEHSPIPKSLPHVVDEAQKDIFIDAHFYRMDRDGTWSHKDGWNSVATNVDSVRKAITDPLEANRYSSRDGYTYSRLMGFFAVPKYGAQLFSTRQGSFDVLESHIQKTLAQQARPRVA